jgi:hypothetical protein
MKNTNTLYKNLLNTTGSKVKPVIAYSDLILGANTIFKDNKGKSGVYSLTNLITGAIYVGSAVYLILDYVITFLLNFLKKNY